MTTPDAWHVDRELLRRYADGRLDPAVAWSLEQHVTGCSDCRAEVARTDARPLVDPVRLETIWAEVEATVDVPVPTLVERVLLAIGVPDHAARLLAATPALTLPWFLAVALVLGAAAAVAHLPDTGPLPFLTLAPLVPLVGVALAFGRWSDPAHDIALAAPIRTVELVLVRAAAVTTTSFLVAAAAAVTMPGLGWLTAAWVLPGVAVTTGLLALSTWWPPVTAAAVLGAGWVSLVLVTETVTTRSFASFTAAGQALAVAVAAVAAVVVRARRDALEQGRAA